MKYQGIIFDLDGVICSTDEYHYLAWKALADRLGIPFDRERNNLLRGVSRMASLEIILEKAGRTYTEAEKAAFAEEKNAAYRQLLGRMSPADLSEDVRTTLEALRKTGLKLAIGSSSKNTPFILERIGLSGRDAMPSKRQEVKLLLRDLKRTNPDVEKNVFNAIHAVQLDTFPGYKTGGQEHSFLERLEDN